MSDPKRSIEYFDKAKKLHSARWHRNHPGTVSDSKKIFANDLKPYREVAAYQPKASTKKINSNATRPSTSVMTGTPSISAKNILLKPDSIKTFHRNIPAPNTAQLTLDNPYSALAKEMRKADKQSKKLAKNSNSTALISAKDKPKTEAKKIEKVEKVEKT